MKTIKYIFFLISALCFASCEKIIDMDINEYPPKLVLNAVLNPDSLVYGNVSKSLAILDNYGSPYLPEGSVNVFENEQLIETLSIDAKGNFKSNTLKPKPGTSYKLEAYSKDFKTVTGEAFVPDTALNFTIDTLSKIRNAAKWDLNRHFFVMNVTINDNPSIENYYIISVKNEYRDTAYTGGYYTEIQTNSTLVEMSSWGSEDELDIVDQSGGGLDFSEEDDSYIYGSQLAFSDATFNGKKATINLETNYENTYDTLIHSIVIRSVSKDYYTYLKSIAMYRTSDSPFTEKVQVYSNIKNGYGIISCESKNKKSILRRKNAEPYYYDPGKQEWE